MTVYKLDSGNGGKVLEVIAEERGIRCRLRLADEAAPYFESDVNGMLLYSTGKPWRLERAELHDPKVVRQGDSIEISGGIGSLAVSLRFACIEPHLLGLHLSWTNTSLHNVEDAAVGLLLELPQLDGERLTIPHMIYNNNPSADPERLVPHVDAKQGSGFVCEEHRLPIPCVQAEWQAHGQSRYLSLFSVPAAVAASADLVQYGTLGALRGSGGGMTLAATSGVLMMNGEKDTVYVGKSKARPYDGGYIDLPPGGSLHKTYALDWGCPSRAGHAFREVVHAGMELYKPSVQAVRSTEETIRLKANALNDRWREKGDAAGYVKFTDSNDFGNVSGRPLHYMYGWTGQCLKLAWCDAKLALESGPPDRLQRCRKAVDFYVRGSGTGVSGLRYVVYHLEEGRWDGMRWNRQPVVSSRAYGETVCDLADIVALFQHHRQPVPEAWSAALREAADYLLQGISEEGIYPFAWFPDGEAAPALVTAAGIPCSIALMKAYRVTGDGRYLAQAQRTMERYYELHAHTFDRPFARSTLDAKCEDKEAGMYFFLGAYELFLLTRDERYKAWAEIAADWILTYVYMWNPAYPPGTPLDERRFSAVGWPGVSVQNHHLDVFFPTFALWDFGRRTGNSVYMRWGRMIFDAIGQGICEASGDWGFTVVGEQGEGFYQTNYHGRGGHNNWNPSWVIALVLQNALWFRESEAT